MFHTLSVKCRVSYFVFVCLLSLGIGFVHAADVVVDFEDLTLPAESASPGDASQSPFASHGVEFNRTYYTEFDCCPGAWAYSNQTDAITAGVGNAFSSITGGGVNGSANYGVAYNSFRGEATISLPEPAQVVGMYVSNTTYTYRAIVDGVDSDDPDNPRLFIDGPFQSGDQFRLDIIGKDATGQPTGQVEFFLADYRTAESAISDWTWVDLSGLGDDVAKLEFNLDSTKQNEFGPTTPLYFAMDDLTLRFVPEPTSNTMLLGIIGILWFSIARRRKR